MAKAWRKAGWRLRRRRNAYHQRREEIWRQTQLAGSWQGHANTQNVSAPAHALRLTAKALRRHRGRSGENRLAGESGWPRRKREELYGGVWRYWWRRRRLCGYPQLKNFRRLKARQEDDAAYVFCNVA